MLEAVEQATELVLIVASFAEVGVEVVIGKLSVPDDPHDQVLRSDLRTLALTFHPRPAAVAATDRHTAPVR